MAGPSSSRGFTLIEVLVAASILFMVIAIGSVAFEQMLHSRQRIDENVRLYQLLPMLKGTIKAQVEANNQQFGTLEFQGLEIEWDIDTIEQKPPFLSLGGGESGATFSTRKLSLVEVTLTVAGSELQVNYKELLWVR